jgi:flavin reductase (DIM6/NTAB) family NADH-FMN oxidoreductase RutF
MHRASTTVPPDPAVFRDLCGEYATGVTVVTATSPDGPRAATVNAFCSLSLDPPQVIVCLRSSSRTWAAIRQSGCLAVNILAADQEGLARQYASADSGKMVFASFINGLSGIPVIPDSMATFECEVADSVASSTHVIVICSVMHAYRQASRPPLVFFRHRLRRDLPAEAPTAASTGSSPGSGA